MDLNKTAQLTVAICNSELLHSGDYALVVSGTDAIGNGTQDKVVLFIAQRLRVLLQNVCSNITLKNMEEIFDIITPFFEGQPLEVVQKSCIVELIGSCLQKLGSLL